MRAILLLTALIGVSAVRAGNLDLVFVVDGSTSICGSTEPCSAWTAILQFIRDIVDTLTIGPDDTKVALVTFGDYATLQWNLDGHTDKASLLTAIDSVPFPGGTLQANGRVRAVVEGVFNTTIGDRPDVSNVDVMITDGDPISTNQSAQASSTALTAKGITVLVVGIPPGCNEHFSQYFASPPQQLNDTYFLVDGAIDSVKEALLNKINALKDGK